MKTANERRESFNAESAIERALSDVSRHMDFLEDHFSEASVLVDPRVIQDVTDRLTQLGYDVKRPSERLLCVSWLPEAQVCAD